MHLPLREMEWFSWEKKRLQLIVAFQYLKRANKNSRENLSSRVCSVSTRANGFKLKERGFKLDIRNNFFVMNVVAP